MSSKIWRKPILWAIGISGYGIVSYASYHVYKIYNLPEPAQGCSDPKNQIDYSKVYNQIDNYDEKVGWDEWLMRLGKHRQYICSKAYGDVLEVSSGTGRNLNFYNPSNISSLTITDASKSMLQHALEVFREYRQNFQGKKVDFRLEDCQRLGFRDNAFDTVVDTFGLCSQSNPTAAVMEMKRVCQKHGRILFLEHGRSYYSWLNRVLDKTALGHAQKWGCYWNRDVIRIIQECELEIEEIERYHLGTTYRIIAKVPSK
jgi:methyltransferase OMS1